MNLWKQCYQTCPIRGMKYWKHSSTGRFMTMFWTLTPSKPNCLTLNMTWSSVGKHTHLTRHSLPKEQLPLNQTTQLPLQQPRLLLQIKPVENATEKATQKSNASWISFATNVGNQVTHLLTAGPIKTAPSVVNLDILPRDSGETSSVPNVAVQDIQQSTSSLKHPMTLPLCAATVAGQVMKQTPVLWRKLLWKMRLTTTRKITQNGSVTQVLPCISPGILIS